VHTRASTNTLDALGRQDVIAKAFRPSSSSTPRWPGRRGAVVQAATELRHRNGVSADDFAKAYNSFTVNSNLQRAEQLTQRYHVEGVP